MRGKKFFDSAYEKSGFSPTEYYMYYFSQETERVGGKEIKKIWKSLNPIEKRFIYYLNDAYPDWEQYTIDRLCSEDITGTMTYLQYVVCKKLKLLKQHRREKDVNAPDIFDHFFRILLSDLPPPIPHDELSTFESNLEFADLKLTKLPSDFATIEWSIDALRKSDCFSHADSFELACYFFAIAFLVLRERESLSEYEHAMLEAFMHLGEFRAWCTAEYELKIKFRDHQNKKNGGDSKAEKEFGPHKKEVIRIMDEEVLQQGLIFKTKSDLITLLTDRLNKYIEECGLKKSKDTFNMIKGWSIRNDNIKKKFNELMSHKK